MQPAWLGVSEGQGRVKGHNLGVKCAFSAFAVPATPLAGFADR